MKFSAQNYMSITHDMVLPYSVVVFGIIMWLIYIIQPSALFTKTGEIKSFGVRREQSTIIPLWLFVIVLSVGIFMGLYSCVSTRKK